MTPGFTAVLAASERDRRDLFTATARRFGMAEQNVEKDFWVCWTLDALFNGLGADGPRLLFKGGTSLSKAYGLITRFSEDIDITVFRADLGQEASVEELEGLSGKKRRARLDAIKEACQAFVAGDMREGLLRVLGDCLEQAGMGRNDAQIDIDAGDPDRQSLLLHYPSVTASGGYLNPAVKIESGAKSALDPHRTVLITPYVSDEVPDLQLAVTGVTAVDPERTFWDKVIILHGLRRWFERRNVLRAGGQRVSRHYYDVHCLMSSPVGDRALADRILAIDCARHARMFFNMGDLDLATAEPGTFALVPTDGMVDPLRRDYEAMAGMIFGTVPEFNTILESVGQLQKIVNDQRP
jgi:hypothetical protein